VVEPTHQLDVVDGTPPAEALGQIGGKPVENLFTVAGAALAGLLKLDDVPADLPVGRRHDHVDGASGGATRLVEQRDDVAQERGVGIAAGGRRGFGARGFHRVGVK
jgi:hypothetical protein